MTNVGKWMMVAAAMTMTFGAMGCHTRLKKFARESEEVSVRVTVAGRPTVDLVEQNPNENNSVVGAVGNMVVGSVALAESKKTQRRIEGLLTPDRVLGLATVGVQDELGGGYPFGLSEGRGDGYLQFNLIDYGIIQSGGGPTFFANYNMVIYRGSDNKRVYRNTVSCRDREFYVPNTALNLAGTIATIDYLRSLNDDELLLRVEAALDRCISRSFEELRRHAS